jgi:hypothetical protein
MTNAPDQPARDAGGASGRDPGSASGRDPGSASGRAASTARTGPAAGTTQADAPGQRDAGPQGAAARQYVPRQSQGYEGAYAGSGPRGAAMGLTIMAAVLMMISGVWGFFEGLAAIIRGSFFVVTRNYVYDMSATGWGWIHLILGVLIAAAGAALLADMLWARITGVVLASLVTISNFLFIPYYPVWSIVLIGLNVFIIWALLTPRRDYG